MDMMLGRKVKVNLPVRLQNNLPNTVTTALQDRQAQQKYYHDQRSGPELPRLYTGQQVRVCETGNGSWIPATIIAKCAEPRSYVVQTPNGNQLRRNRAHIRDCPTTTIPKVTFADEETGPVAVDPSPAINPQPVLRRSGRITKKPERLDL